MAVIQILFLLGANRLDANKQFAVVVFTDGSTSLISSSWLRGVDTCYWPPSGNKRKLAKSHAAVEDDWILNSCRIIGTAGMLCSDSYVTIFITDYNYTCLLHLNVMASSNTIQKGHKNIPKVDDW